MKTQERASGAQHLNAEVWKEKDDTEVRWLGGAGFFVRARGTALLLDPCLWIGADGRAETGFAPFYPPVLRPEEVPAGTAVLYTHSDEDHLGRRTAQALAGAAFYGPAPCARALSEIGREAVRVIRPGEKFAVGCIEIEAIPADHGWQSMDVKKYGAPFGPEDCVGYILRTPHAKLLFPGDTRLMPQHRALPDDFDAMAFDVSADPWHMGARDGAELARHLSRAKLLPCHFGTYDAPEAVPHNGSLILAREALGDAAARLASDAIGAPVIFGAE